MTKDNLRFQRPKRVYCGYCKITHVANDSVDLDIALQYGGYILT